MRMRILRLAVCTWMLALLGIDGPLANAQSETSLLVTTDFDCTWQLDGQPQGQLKADDAKKVTVTPGQHLIRAVSTDGSARFRTVIDTASGQGQMLVLIGLKAQLEAKSGDLDREQNPIWTDPSTGLMWTRKDNGSDVTWQQAANYCQNLSLGGYSGWRLPTIDQLAAIYDQTQNVPGWHIKGGILLTAGWAWSGSQGDASGEAWRFYFPDGYRFSGQLGNIRTLRALCMRGS
jgi:Protein of unknown function (DUF1566)